MTVSTVKKSHTTIRAACVRRNVVHDSEFRPGAGSIPAVLRIVQMVDAAMVMPSGVSSPWMRRYPHVGFSRREADDQFAGLDGGGGSAGPVRVGPMVRDESSMPTQDRVGPDYEDGQ